MTRLARRPVRLMAAASAVCKKCFSLSNTGERPIPDALRTKASKRQPLSSTRRQTHFVFEVVQPARCFSPPCRPRSRGGCSKVARRPEGTRQENDGAFSRSNNLELQADPLLSSSGLRRLRTAPSLKSREGGRRSFASRGPYPPSSDGAFVGAALARRRTSPAGALFPRLRTWASLKRIPQPSPIFVGPMTLRKSRHLSLAGGSFILRKGLAHDPAKISTRWRHMTLRTANRHDAPLA